MKNWLYGLFGIAFLAAVAGGILYSQRSMATEIVVYKTPTCGCCGKWEDHLRQAGFKVTSKPMENINSIKAEHQIPSDLWSCHTALVGGYVIEGHVPASAIKKLLAAKPTDSKGLAVPGMPIGSPGMEGPNPEKYDVVSIQGDGSAKVFESF